MSWEKVENDVCSGPLGLTKWLVISIVTLTVIFGGIRWITMPAEKAVERVVFKNSWQYKEGMEQRAATLEASLAEVDMNIQKYPEQREELLAQRKVIEMQLRAITINN